MKNYFDGKLPDWEEQANTFYNHFDSLGWRTASGAKVEKWDSRANLWIIEKRTQKPQSYGNGQKSGIGTKQEANDYATQQLAMRIQQREQGVLDEEPKPF